MSMNVWRPTAWASGTAARGRCASARWRSRPGTWRAGRPERRGQDHAAEPGRRPGGADSLLGLAVLPGTRLAEEVAQGGDDQARGFFGQEVTGGQRLAAHVGGILLPDAERLVAAADETLRPPQHLNR